MFCNYFEFVKTVLTKDYQCFTDTIENKSKKVIKSYCLNGKRFYFCTRNNGDVLLNTDKRLRFWKEIFEKKIKKSLWEVKTLLTFAPRKNGKFFERLIREIEMKTKIKVFKKKFQIFLPVKKRISTFAPANRNNEKRGKQEEYVPRHIELTAVSMQIETNKKKSKIIERLE